MYLRTFRLSRISAGLLLAVASTTTQAIEPSDPLYESSIYVGPSYFQWGLQTLNLEAAWDLSRGHAYLGVADSGIDTDHPDLVGNFRPQFSYDFASSCPPEDIYIKNAYPSVVRCIENPDPEAEDVFDNHPTELSDSNVDELASDDNFYTQDSPVAGHGTHVAGIMAATANNNIGTAGICWNCSLMVSRQRMFKQDVDDSVRLNAQADSLIWFAENGAQVINRSGEDSITELDPDITCNAIPDHYRNDQLDPHDFNANIAYEKAVIKYCDALATLEEFDIVLVAAAGNVDVDEIQFPASDPRTISVGAIDIWGSATPIAGSIATDVPEDIYYTEVRFNRGPEKDFVAPGFNVLSTFYYSPSDIYSNGESYVNGAVWNVGGAIFRPECADYKSVTKGYGPCSGTSMAAPHVTGLVGLLRSINPLLRKDQIKDSLTKYANNSGINELLDHNVYGYGVPNALDSVKDVLGQSGGRQLTNRAIPLFSLYSQVGKDFFYTTKPQMAMAAMYGSMQPQPANQKVNWYPFGLMTPGYASFPKPMIWWDETPRAYAYIFSTHVNPFDSARELAPLYRLSKLKSDAAGNMELLDHTYATKQSEVDMYIDDGYQLDGIEGYVFPNTEPRPAGTVRLYRKKNPTREDNAIFPETLLTYMNGQGYTQNSGESWIGYVYANQDSDWDGVIDGFEDILGTNKSNSDSDGDGISDGIEVNSYPYGDPMNPAVY